MTIHFAPTDSDTASLLDLIEADPMPWASDDRDRIEAAILADAAANAGHVSPNRVRAVLAGRVAPQRVGPTYRRLVLADVIAPDGWELSDDLAGRNSGKPHRTYRRVTS